MTLKSKFAWTIFSLQFIFIIIYGIFAQYGPDADASDPKHNISPETGGQRPKDNIINKDYPMFQDINAMIFIGIGFLYAFLRKYSYTGVGMNFLLCAIGVQWGMITKGVWNMRNGKLDIDAISLIQGEFAAASGMIALGGIFGKVGLIQMVAFVIIEIFVYSSTDYLSHNYLQVSDVGESVALHLFAAIFGCSAAYTLDKKVNVKGNPHESNSYNSNLFCILGTVVLWVYWPSFNSAGDEGDSQHRNVINTFLGLVGSAITCFAMSALLNKESKFTMSHIQNGALAGAVGVGSTSNLMIQPFGALAIGALSGCLSVAGFKYFSPFLGKVNVYDPCGIHSLHGLPGLFAGILGILATFLADKENYGYSLYKFYPAMAPLTNTTELYELQANSSITIEPGIGRTIEYQALYQFIYVLVTIAIACLTGLITGAILRMRIFDPIEDKQMYIDDIMWELPDIEVDQPKEERKISQMSEKL